MAILTLQTETLFNPGIFATFQETEISLSYFTASYVETKIRNFMDSHAINLHKKVFFGTSIWTEME